MTYRDLHRKLHEHPFKPFRIRMDNNTLYDVPESWRVVVGDTSAIIVTRTRKDNAGVEVATDWTTVSIDHMTSFSALKRSNGTRGRD